MRQTLTTILVLGFALLLVVVSIWDVATADEGGIRVRNAQAESSFPDGIRFTIDAESPGVIDDVRVFFRKAEQEGRSAYRAIEVEPGAAVSGETLLPARTGAQYFPPGTKIEYSFEIRDKAGAVLRTEPQVFVYDDIRFEWQSLTEGLITVYYYGDYVQERAQVILDAATETTRIMVPVLGAEPSAPLRIVAYNNQRHMAAALPFRSQAVQQDLQVQGMAFSDDRVLLIHAFDATVTGTTAHEFTHLLVAEAAGPAIARVPAWLNEGLAEYGNIDATDDYTAALRYGIFTRRLRPLWYLSSFSGSPDDVLIAYGQGRSVVNYLIGAYGPDKIAELMRVIQESPNIDQALMQVYGFDQHGLDSEWREAIGLEPLPSPEEVEARQAAAEEAETAEEAEAAAASTPEPAEEPAPESTPAADGESSAAATPTPESAATEPTPPGSLLVAEATATPTPDLADGGAFANPGAPNEPGESGGGCNAAPGGGQLSAGMLALLAMPLSLGLLAAVRRRR